MRLLVIEDKQELLNLIGKRLKEEGYAVDLAKDGKEGLSYAESVNYDCIILDIMLPIIDGFTVIQKLRSIKINSQIIVLSVKSDTVDKVNGLDYGADDYITKPFSFDELIARIRAQLRKKYDEKETVLTYDGLALDLISREVYRDNKLIVLTAKEFSILEYFLRNKGRVLTKSQIAEHVWSYEFDFQSNVIQVYIRYLRKKIDDDHKKKLIQTVRGVGYRLK